MNTYRRYRYVIKYNVMANWKVINKINTVSNLQFASFDSHSQNNYIFPTVILRSLIRLKCFVRSTGGPCMHVLYYIITPLAIVFSTLNTTPQYNRHNINEPYYITL